MLTPSKYWRIACALDADTPLPPTEYAPPEHIASQTRPPMVGDGFLLAAYDEAQETGLIRYVGIVKAGRANAVSVEWRPVHAEIWVDTRKGRDFWKNRAGFGFATTKIAGYGLHELFAESFEDLEAREPLSGKAQAVRAKGLARPKVHAAKISPERLNPIEVIGTPTTTSRGGVVYVLKSAYGYKVGRTRNVPARMRAFGVHLPILYTIPLCVWFEDCIVAEKRYHDLFQEKRINGVWFDLSENDIEQIRIGTAA